MIFTDMFCPLRGAPCRHCSNEGTRRSTKACSIDKHLEIRVVQEIAFGLYCNSYCDWLRNVQSCELCHKTPTERDGEASGAKVWNKPEHQTGQVTLGL